MPRYVPSLLSVLALFAATEAVARGPLTEFILRTTINSGDEAALIGIINEANANTNTTYEVTIVDTGEDFVFDSPLMGTDTALPEITGDIFLKTDAIGIGFRRADNATMDFRLLRIGECGRIWLTGDKADSFIVSNFRSSGDGGAVLADGKESRSSFEGVLFIDNFAAGNGGAFAFVGDPDANGFLFHSIRLSRFQNNRANEFGGAISFTGMAGTAQAQVIANTFVDNTARVFGDDINVDTSAAIYLYNNVFSGNAPTVRIENRSGTIRMHGNTLSGSGEAIDSIADARLLGNLFDMTPNSNEKATCNDFGSGAFSSLGYNINSDDACSLDATTDLSNTNPGLAVPNASGIVALQPQSVAIDSGAVNPMVDAGDWILPCGPIDIRGLGRPQDANGDGVFECDRGGWEMQGGPDIGPGQSGAFFDPTRPGEGVFVEMLEGGLAFIAIFTYEPNATAPAWFVGLGRVVGNSIVVTDLQRPVGGLWGAGFDPDSVERRSSGTMSLVFPSCEAEASPGRLVFDGFSPDGFEPLLVAAQRLTTIVSCDSFTAQQTGLSGSFFDVNRSGEGVFVQWLDANNVVVIMYTFDTGGNQLWFINDTGRTQIEGNTVTAEMLYPASLTGFGRDFDPNEISLLDFGTITATWNGCDAVDFNVAPRLEGFEAVSYEYVRLTTLAGTQCP